HKFESRYLDQLVAPYPEGRARYLERSPLHHTEGLACPVAFLQGLRDQVVPPDQAQTMVDAVRAKGIPVIHLSFPEEGHGFHRAETIRRCLEAELSFYREALGLPPESEA
ncbi:MAG TPA: prolyl oligopeptidase family serine peptidase, partial [Gammaproteobacteria bacterium]|nr:prolyl oligopeptidase family serine peptidase [Gammaproteobacteria bacterium]